MRKILVALALILTLIAFSAANCGLTSDGPWVTCTYRLDYTNQDTQLTVSDPPPNSVVDGGIKTLVPGTCHK